MRQQQFVVWVGRRAWHRLARRGLLRGIRTTRPPRLLALTHLVSCKGGQPSEARVLHLAPHLSPEGHRGSERGSSQHIPATANGISDSADNSANGLHEALARPDVAPERIRSLSTSRRSDETRTLTAETWRPASRSQSRDRRLAGNHQCPQFIRASEGKRWSKCCARLRFHQRCPEREMREPCMIARWM